MDGWSALADPTRRHIFELVVARPRAVGEIADVMPISRPAVSQHLKALKTAGLVQDRPEGTRRIYTPDPEGLRALREQLDSFWDQALTTYATLVEDPEEDT